MNDSKVPNWLMNASDRIIEHMNDDHPIQLYQH